MTTEAVQTRYRVTPLDPRDRSTWKNIPSPVDLAPINAALRDAGGVNEFGEQNFIIVWGQEYRTWDAGRMRIHFDDENVDAIHTPNRFACRPEIFAAAAAWLEKKNKERSDAYMRLDLDGIGDHPDVTEFLKSHAIEGVDYFKLPSDIESETRLAGLMPDGWMYLNGHWTFEHIGQQAYYVIQYFRPQEFGSETEWNELRFAEAYCPETDRDEPLVDVIGPFPSHGQYELPIIRIANVETYEDRHPVIVGQTIKREIYRFKEPSIDMVVPRVRELIAIRDSLTMEQKDPVERTRSRFKEFRDKRRTRNENWRKEFSKKFHSAMPVGKGNPTNVSANKTKFEN